MFAFSFGSIICQNDILMVGSGKDDAVKEMFIVAFMIFDYTEKIEYYHADIWKQVCFKIKVYYIFDVFMWTFL